jgi:hypothetical protein
MPVHAGHHPWRVADLRAGDAPEPTEPDDSIVWLVWRLGFSKGI